MTIPSSEDLDLPQGKQILRVEWWLLGQGGCPGTEWVRLRTLSLRGFLCRLDEQPLGAPSILHCSVTIHERKTLHYLNLYIVNTWSISQHKFFLSFFICFSITLFLSAFRNLIHKTKKIKQEEYRGTNP